MKYNTNPCDMIHFYYSFSQPFYNSQFPEYPLDHCVWHSIRFLLLVYNSIKQCLPFCINVSCSYYIKNFASVVPFPNKKTNDSPSVFSFYLKYLSNALSNTFIPYSTNFITRYHLHNNGSYFRQYFCIVVLNYQSIRNVSSTIAMWQIFVTVFSSAIKATRMMFYWYTSIPIFHLSDCSFHCHLCDTLFWDINYLSLYHSIQCILYIQQIF